MPTFTVAQLAERVAGAVVGDATSHVTGVAPLGEAGRGDLTFVAGARYVSRLGSTRPSAILVPDGLELDAPGSTLIRVTDPQLAFSRLVPLFHPPEPLRPGVATTASLGAGASLGSDVRIEPYALIGDGAKIGDRSCIGSFTVIEAGAELGDDCRIAHSCSILADVQLGDRVLVHPGTRIGTDGFGYARGPEGAVKIPQVGGCRVGDDVEIGANCTIDRGSLGDTSIGARTKIDNLVHIGHNVEVGEDCMIVAQVGVAGSVRIGQGAALAGQAGIAGHLTIGPGARIAAQAGVIGNVPPGAEYSGYPARPHAHAMRASAALLKLPDALKRLEALERRLGDRDDGARPAIDSRAAAPHPVPHETPPTEVTAPDRPEPGAGGGSE